MISTESDVLLEWLKVWFYWFRDLIWYLVESKFNLNQELLKVNDFKWTRSGTRTMPQQKPRFSDLFWSHLFSPRNKQDRTKRTVQPTMHLRSSHYSRTHGVLFRHALRAVPKINGLTWISTWKDGQSPVLNIIFLLVLNAGNGWEWGNGMIITSDTVSSDYGSFPHSLLSTTKPWILQLSCVKSDSQIRPQSRFPHRSLVQHSKYPNHIHLPGLAWQRTPHPGWFPLQGPWHGGFCCWEFPRVAGYIPMI